MVGAVAQHHGDEAGDFVNRANMTVMDSRERVSLDE